MLRPIVRYGARRAAQRRPEPVTTFDADCRRSIDDMVETMYAAPGIGLAAPQVGVPLRVCVIDSQRRQTRRRTDHAGQPASSSSATACSSRKKAA